MAGATKPVNARRLASLARRASDLCPLRDLTLTFAGAAHPFTIALPADPDAPLDRFAAVLGAPISENAEINAELYGGQQSDTEVKTGETAKTTREKHSVKLPSTPLNSVLVSASSSASPNAIAADQARRSVASGTHMPYWGLLWPSGLALAEALLTEVTIAHGARALELGCGLGVTATAALECNLSLTAMDCFTEALLVTRYNARRNTGREPRTLLADWRSTEGRAACLAAGPQDVVLAADVLYEEEDIAPLLVLAPRLLVPGGTFWLAEPGRRVSRLFVEAARARGWRSEARICEQPWPPDGDLVRVSVHRFEHII
jgi:predicted nicotinamide N-methyase